MSGIIDLEERDDQRSCVSCQRLIDRAAKLCPYCGANPETGEKFDSTPLVKEHFPPRPEQSAADRAFGFFRARQGAVVVLGLIILVVGLAAIHNWAAARNSERASDVPSIALTEIADLANQREPAERVIPDLKFSYDGNARTMQTFLLEPGAVAPTPSPLLSPQAPGAGPLRVPSTTPQQQTLPERLPSNPASAAIRPQPTPQAQQQPVAPSTTTPR